MPGKPTTVKQYLDALPADRRKALQAIRKVIKANLHKDLAEGIQWGGISYHVPHRVYPYGYHCDPTQALPVAGLMAQKKHIGLSLMSVYGDPAERAWFTKAWTKGGRTLDMGAACVRIKWGEEAPLDVIAKAIKRIKPKAYIARYEQGLAGTAAGKKLAKRKAAAPAGKRR